MVDQALLERKITLLKEKKATLLEWRLRKYTDFLKGPYPKAVEKLLQEMVEICIDVGKHLIADEGLPIAGDSKGIFQILFQSDVISKKMCATMQKMVGFRNLVIHLYEKIDNEVVYQIYRRHLKDFDDFVKEVLGYMRRKPYKKIRSYRGKIPLRINLKKMRKNRV